MLAVLVLRIRRQERAHPLFGAGVELEPEPLVDRADRRERIGHEGTELHVDDATCRDRSVLARGDGAVEPVENVVGEVGRRIGDRRVVTRQRPEPRDQRRQRRDDPQWIAVRLHQEGVRVLAEQRVERPEVSRRLEHPTSRRAPRLQVLQEHAVPAVRGSHVGLVQQPAGVRRYAVLRREDHAAEVGGGDPHAFLR